MFDKYTKLMLTIIAVGIIGINIHIYKGSVIEDAYANANTGNNWQVISHKENHKMHTYIFKDNGTKVCLVKLSLYGLDNPSLEKTGTWYETRCM